jgi:hypothetical protein
MASVSLNQAPIQASKICKQGLGQSAYRAVQMPPPPRLERRADLAARLARRTFQPSSFW